MKVIEEKCTGCGYCLLTCPEKAISSDGWARVDAQTCTDCNQCLFVCPNNAMVPNTPMNRPKPKLSKAYDAIIIGAGIAGLMAGAALAQSGRRIAILERLSFIGGRYTEIDHRGYRVTTAAWTSLGEISNIGRFLRELGAQVEYVSLQDLGRSEQFSIRFPDGRSYSSIKAMISSSDFRAFLLALAKGRKQDLSQINSKDYLERYLKNQDLLATVDAVIGTASGVKMENFPASEYITIAMDTAAAGQHFAFPKGGVRSLIEALERVITQNGGEIHAPTEVEEIRVSDGRAEGVRLTTGEEVESELVIHNGGIRGLVKLVREENLPAEYVARIRRQVPMDCAALILGTVEPLFQDAPILMTPRCQRVVGIFAPTLLDPSVAPKGRHMVDVFFPILSADRQAELKLAWQDLRNLFPRLDELVELSVPMLFIGAWTGAESAQVVGQTGERRFDPRTPIDGLYLVGMDAVGSGAAGDLIPIGVNRMLQYLQEDRCKKER